MSKIYTLKFSHIPITQAKQNQAVAGAIEIRTTKIAAFVRLGDKFLLDFGDARMTTCLRPWGLGLSEDEASSFSTQEFGGQPCINCVYVDLSVYSEMQAMRPETMYSLWYELGLVHYALTTGETMDKIRAAREAALESGALCEASLDAESFAVRHTSSQAAQKAIKTMLDDPNGARNLSSRELPLRVKALEKLSASPHDE